MFKEGDKVTVLLNLQCHGTVLNSNEENTNVKLDNFSSPSVFKTSELKLREVKQ